MPTTGPIDHRWASDIDFDGLRLEALSPRGEALFDISVPDDGPITINTFGKEIAAELIFAAVQIAQQRHKHTPPPPDGGGSETWQLAA